MTTTLPLFPVTALYAGLLALMAVFFAFLVARQRLRSRVALGAGQDAQLETRIRIHGNFVEYVPLTLILMAIAESGGLNVWALHGLGVWLVLARISHAYALSRGLSALRFRQFGIASNWLILVILAGACIAHYIGTMLSSASSV